MLSRGVEIGGYGKNDAASLGEADGGQDGPHLPTDGRVRDDAAITRPALPSFWPWAVH